MRNGVPSPLPCYCQSSHLQNSSSRTAIRMANDQPFADIDGGPFPRVPLEPLRYCINRSLSIGEPPIIYATICQA